MQETYRVLSIDAWRDPEGGWTWNGWYQAGSIHRSTVNEWGWPVNARKALHWFRREGYITKASAGKVAIEDDGYNVVVVARGTREPLFAVEYGCDV